MTAVKNVALGEEYLADHFPSFPVLPGVFMLEAMTQAGAWLVRLTDDFQHSMIVLQEARNIKYADFVPPGASLEIEVELLAVEGALVKLKGHGELNDGRQAVSGRFTLRRFNLADDAPEKAHVDAELIRRLHDLKSILMATAAR